MVYTLRFFFSSKFSLFHNSNAFGSCIIHILYTECAKIKINSGAKRLIKVQHKSYRKIPESSSTLVLISTSGHKEASSMEEEQERLIFPYNGSIT